MEHLSIALRALFSRQDGDKILQCAGFINNSVQEPRHLDTDFDESEINKLLQLEEQSIYSVDQLSMTGQLVISKWMSADPNCLPVKFADKSSVFNVLLHFGAKILMVKDGDPVCRYDSLLRWHVTTTQLGEDLFTTSFLASKDLSIQYSRNDFDWDAFVGHNSKELNVMFEKPMAELHMHLKGSSYNVDISWLCLMNHIHQLYERFVEVGEKRKDKEWFVDLYNKIERAANIRLYLASVTGCVTNGISKAELFDKQQDEYKNSKGDKVAIKGYRGFKDTLKEYHDAAVEKAVQQGIDPELVLDYIPVEHYNNEYISNLVMASERKLMYNCFKTIYSNDYDPDFATLFYAYLVHKDLFRHTILQLNARVGFANFASYEELKSTFILDRYSKLLYKAAIEGFIGKADNRFVEARIVPKNTVEGIEKSLKDIYESISKNIWPQCGIIFHFIKKRDESFKGDKDVRHNILRNEIKQQAIAIYKFRQLKGKDIVGSVLGIDAANSEIFTRPEVFAQAFRFLREKEVFDSGIKRPYDLKITYHVGEDFLDIADGLRAVEEAMIFLGLRNGDRLGHALVLGTDVRTYYHKRYDTICESKQVILDNLAWLHHKCVRLIGYCPLCGYLEIMFHKYFRDMYNINTQQVSNIIDEIFSEPDDEIVELDDVETYYLSWLLRGNSPTFGTDFALDNIRNISDVVERRWLEAGFNHHRGVEMACRNSNARNLFDRYHSHKLAFKSNEVDSFTIPHEYREEYYELLEKIQEDLMQKIEKRHIAIECNPSSNYKIGEMDRYDQHPILRFFNYGIDTPYKDHNISVSINTDDQGVFSTSLEREYSLMALAMERNEIHGHHNSPRAILEWLDRVREMSIEQRFDIS